MKISDYRKYIIKLVTIILAFSLILLGDSQISQSSKPRHNMSANIQPYSDDSPWNLKIGPNPVYDERSDHLIKALEGFFGSSPDFYTMPIYEVSDSTPIKKVVLSNYFSEVIDNNTRLIRTRFNTVEIPIPDGAEQATGTDAQIVMWNPKTGDEWGFWKAYENTDGTWSATNGYHYNTNWNGVPPKGFMSRGAGVPYFVGLIRPWEIEQERIEHAIAFAYDYPNNNYIYPATKSDGKGSLTDDMPEGARLQLDPSLTEEDFDRWGLSKSGKIIARALQEYGMIIIDNSGHPKIYPEYEGTAHWNGVIENKTPENIPYSAFKLLSLATPQKPPAPQGLVATSADGSVTLSWNSSKWATRYGVKRRTANDTCYAVIARWVTDTTYIDKNVRNGTPYSYVITAVNHNGISGHSNVVTITPGASPVRPGKHGTTFQPDKYRLEPNYPNPFNDNTVISYVLASKTSMDLSIYNLEGQRIAELTSGLQSAGNYSVKWDGIDDIGKPVASGIYLVRLKAGALTKIKKMCLLR